MEIRSLGATDFDTIFEAFEQAFADYEVRNDKEQLRAMLDRRGFDPALSFAAFENGVITAFTLNGTGNFSGIPTAYDTGTGTLTGYRGRGLATGIFEYSIPYLRENGIRQYLLEVLQHNDKAVSVYSKLGFETTREFYYFLQDNTDVRIGTNIPDERYQIRRIGMEDLRDVRAFWDFAPSWQNDLESIRRASGGFVFLGAFSGKLLLGYSVFEPASGDITQIAVDKNHRRKGVGSELLREMVRLNKYPTLKVINTDVSCRSITGFLEARNIPVRGKQFEMIRKI